MIVLHQRLAAKRRDPGDEPRTASRRTRTGQRARRRASCTIPARAPCNRPCRGCAPSAVASEAVRWFLEAAPRRAADRIDPREAEVEDLDLALVAHHHVVGLEVAVHDAALMRLHQRARDGPRDAERLGERRAPPAHRARRAERPPLHELHRDEGDPVRLARLVDRGDVPVVDRGRGARLAAESAGAAPRPTRRPRGAP